MAGFTRLPSHFAQPDRARSPPKGGGHAATRHSPGFVLFVRVTLGERTQSIEGSPAPAPRSPWRGSGDVRDLALLAAVLALCMLFSFLYPGGGLEGEDIVTIRNVSSLLFSVLSGFFVAFLLNRFAAIRSLLTRESTMLMEMHKLSQAFGPQFAQRTADRIDAYLIIRFDEDNYFRFTAKGRDALFSIFEDLSSIDLGTTQNLTTMHRHFVSTLREAISLRRETIVTGTITVSRLQWCPLLMLALILVTTLFVMKSGSFASSLLTAMLAFAIFLVIFMIKNLSDLKLGGDFLKYETIQRVFEQIGKPRYYPVSHISAGVIPGDVTRIRLGIGRDRHFSDEIVEVSIEEAHRRARHLGAS